jgi:hypothetical protein
MTALPITLHRLGLLCKRQGFPALCGAAWLAIVAAGFAYFWNYENIPGPRAAVPAVWPLKSRIAKTAGLPTLVMFAHPQCPCTRASIGELAVLMAQSMGRVRAHVIFYKPHGFPDEWARTDLWTSAAAIPGVEVSCDEEGVEARQFGAETSGFVVLYDGHGQLRYNGGITSERGHSGDNEGRSAIVAILNDGTPRVAAMPVFGCSFFAPESNYQEGAASCTK